MVMSNLKLRMMHCESVNRILILIIYIMLVQYELKLRC